MAAGDASGDRPGVPLLDETSDTQIYWRRLTLRLSVRHQGTDPHVIFMWSIFAIYVKCVEVGMNMDELTE